jgi:hypothetical protein
MPSQSPDLHKIKSLLKPKKSQFPNEPAFSKNPDPIFHLIGACRLLPSTYHRCPKGGVSKFPTTIRVDSGCGIREWREENPGAGQENQRSHSGTNEASKL